MLCPEGDLTYSSFSFGDLRMRYVTWNRCGEDGFCRSCAVQCGMAKRPAGHSSCGARPLPIVLATAIDGNGAMRFLAGNTNCEPAASAIASLMTASAACESGTTWLCLFFDRS
jgi:hypothetical protein